MHYLRLISFYGSSASAFYNRVSCLFARMPGEKEEAHLSLPTQLVEFARAIVVYLVAYDFG